MLILPRVVSATRLHFLAASCCSRRESHAAKIGSQNSRSFVKSAMNNGDPSIVPASGTHRASVIFMHGLGDQGHGWAQMFREDIRDKHIKYICPHSSSRPVTLNMGMNMPAWYDIIGLDPNAEEDTEGIRGATRYIHQLIDAEVAAGIPANKIVVGGFSMGGALAIYAALTYPQKLGGILGLSAFFLQRNVMPGEYRANLTTPVFLGHGNMDFLVPLAVGKLTEEFIKRFNPNVELRVYNMAHSSCDQEMNDVKRFLEQRIL